MSNIKTVSVSAETAVKFDSFYPFVWIKNTGDTIAYASAFSGIVAGAENVVAVPAGESVMITAETDTVYILSTGTTAEVHGQGFANAPIESIGGGSGGGSITIDDVPTQGSTNAVSSGGTYTAIQAAKATRTLLYTSGNITQGAPYQTDVNLLDNLNKYDLVMILYVADSSTGNEACGTGVYDVQELLTTGYNAHFAGYFCRWSTVHFTNTTFNQTGRGAANEGDQYAPQIFKIYGYKL